MPNSNIEVITSDYIASDIDNRFKITAGPGAGKTYWLVNHIINVLKNSTKLLSTSKIACITYTNVAVEEIQERLKVTGNRVEVSTIHSFLYRNLVKPYAYLLKDDTGECLINYMEMDGHDDHIPSKGKIHTWKSQNNLFRTITDDKKLMDCLKSLDWIFEEDEVVLTTREDYQRKVGRYYVKKEYFPSYKQLYWNEGTLHHEDVLYFSYLILKNYPMIRQFMFAKYPYIFIDEFQDTSPIQTKIIELLAETGIVIGVIGDPAQSIYQFNGASRQDFLDFELPNQKNYIMAKNRRSTKKIVDFLNYLRNSDSFQQDYHREDEGNDVCFVTGSTLLEIIEKFNAERDRLGLSNTHCIISRRNESVAKLKACTSGSNCNHIIWDELYTIDLKRHRFLGHLLIAQEYARDKRYETAVKEIIKIFRTDKEGNLREPFKNSKIEDKMLKRSYAIALLEFLINKYHSNMGKTLYEFYNTELFTLFNQLGLTLKKLTGNGAFKIKSEEVTVGELVNSLNIREVKSNNIRTIHKTKGTEFESVLIYIDRVDELGNIISPNIDYEKDDYRLYYVALSRAKDFLCISVDSLETEQVEKLNQLNIRELK